jgi:hypothetical protein
MNFQLTRRLSADLACLGGLRRLPDENALLRKRSYAGNYTPTWLSRRSFPGHNLRT